MKGTRHSEEQIIAILTQGEAGLSTRQSYAVSTESPNRPYLPLKGEVRRDGKRRSKTAEAVGGREPQADARGRLSQLQLVRAWKSRSAQLKPDFRRTDIIGALFLASQIFNQPKDASKKVLVLFSDMRHSMPDLNLESPSKVRSFSDARKRARMITAGLQRTRAYSLGVDGAGKDLLYWEHLRQFWTEYFRYAGADLRCFSVLRDPPDFLASER
jgi:hypothetical protein